ncbi:hypothetical protein [Mesorhizobium captivum]|uniref:hypothetical protein n=1 Tax=Mesorhizobium captivum TaxID=3072319 RepID=UPI002A23BFD8|nr:hypothetical protein [Mesorhizobium sp. VK23E]MDX8513370.1 hypothetical protein [Mesorhizobium sp. VK23E]
MTFVIIAGDFRQMSFPTKGTRSEAVNIGNLLMRFRNDSSGPLPRRVRSRGTRVAAISALGKGTVDVETVSAVAGQVSDIGGLGRIGSPVDTAPDLGASDFQVAAP